MSVARAVAYEHVAFDLDGTLVDSRADLAATLNHVLLTLGLPPIEPSTMFRYIGQGARALLERAMGIQHRDLVPRGVELFMERYAGHLLDATRPYPGIPEALAALSALGVALSVLTNKPVAMSRIVLEGLDLMSYFVAVLGGDSLSARKPDPAGLKHLRTLTGTPQNRMLLVGDSEIDLQTARADGVGFCGVAWGLTPEALAAAHPERMIGHPSELVILVEGRA